MNLLEKLKEIRNACGKECLVSIQGKVLPVQNWLNSPHKWLAQKEVTGDHITSKCVVIEF